MSLADAPFETAAAKQSGFPWMAMGILFLAHFTVDSQVSFLSSLLPLLMEKHHIALGAGGTLVFLLSMSNAFAQPVTAIVVDRWPRLPWLVTGLVGSAVCLTSIGWLPTFTLVAAVIPVGGILAGLCHPDMASRAGRLSQEHKGLCLSLFITGGRLGFGFGPLIAIGIAGMWGMESIWTFSLVAVAIALGVRYGMPTPERAAVAAGASPVAGLGSALKAARGPLSILIGVTVFRAIVNTNLIGFIPTLYVERGMELWSGGMANAIQLLFGGIGVMLGGVLSDRIGRRTVIAGGIWLACLALIAFLAVPPVLGMVLLAVIGIGMYLPMGVTMALAQDLLPNNRGFASSITLGFSWGVASIAVIPISRIAEHVGLLRTFWALPFFLVVAGLLAICLPAGKPAPRD